MPKSRTLVITGKTGSGKSHYVASFLNAYVIDPLQEPTPNRSQIWQHPALDATVDMVVFDHVHNLKDSTQQILAAHAWCMQYGKPLWLVLQSIKDFEALKLSILYSIEARFTRTPSEYTNNIASIHDRDGIQFPSSFYFEFGKDIGFTAAQKVGTHSIIVLDLKSAT